MRNIEDVRKDISAIDVKIRDLFIERLNLIQEIKEIKIATSYPFVDSRREEEMKNTYTKDLSCYKSEYLELFNKILEISKKTYK